MLLKWRFTELSLENIVGVSVCEMESGVDFLPVITIFQPGTAGDTGSVKFSNMPAQMVLCRVGAVKIAALIGLAWSSPW